MGQSALQNDRLLATARSRTAARTPSLTMLGALIFANPDMTICGIVTWSAEAGHTRQKEYHVSSPRKNGMRNTLNARMKYLPRLALFGRFNFGEGIL